MKFRVGDIITGEKSADKHYSYTTSHATMQVIAVGRYEIEVQIIKHDRLWSSIGDSFWVNPRHFYLVQAVSRSNYIEEE